MDKTKIAVEIFNKHAITYEAKFMDVSIYHNSLDLFCNSLQKPHSDVLELACGPGNITKYLGNKRPDLKILATDLAPNMIDLAKVNNPSVQFQIMDSRNINKLDAKYDGLMCGFIFPYLSKEEAIQLIKDASVVLNDMGVIYISTMEDDYSKSGFKKGSTGDEIYMHFHQADYLIEALNSAGFQILETQRKIYPALDNSLTVDLIILAQKD